MSSSAFSGAKFQKRHVLPLLTSLLIVLVTYAPIASAAIKSFEVDAYGQALDVPPMVAKDDLLVQAKGGEADIAGGLEEGLQDNFAGIWFDPESGEYVVPLVSDAAGDTVRKEMAAAQLTGDYRTAVVQHSWKELEAAQEQIDGRLAEFFKAALIYTSIDPLANTVVVNVASTASEKDRATLLEVTRSVGDLVELRASSDDRFQGVSDACSNIVPNCGRPFRGGVEIGVWKGPSAGICTAGFLATGDTDGRRYVITAGHCAAEKNPSNPIMNWQALDEQKLPFYGEPHYLGAVEQLAFPAHDWMKINASGTWWDEVRPWPTMVAYWQKLGAPTPINAEYQINGEASSIVGQGVCHSGIASGGSCGQVTATNVSYSFGEAGNVTYDLVKVKGACSEAGDSGGPWFATNIAYGIHIGKDTVFETCNSNTFYEEITDATDALGVTITPGIGALPPAVQTAPASEIKETQASLNGSVNPNSAPSSYHFEYGTTTAYGKSSPIPDGSAGSGATALSVSTAISGLQPNTRYHYRLVATNVAGSTYGQDLTFTTGLRWNLRNANSSGGPDSSFWFGLPGESRIVGDWNGDGKSTPGVYNPSTGVWKLRNSNTTGPADITVQYGGPSWTPVVGDWDGNGTTTIGVYDQVVGTWRLKNSNTPGGWDVEFGWGGSVWKPVVGDWDGNGTTTVGIYEPSVGTWRLKNSNTPGGWDVEFGWGGSVWKPVVGDWNGDGKTTVGGYEPNVGTWRLKNSNTAGGWDAEFQYGGYPWSSVTGDWNGDGVDTIGVANPDAVSELTWNLRNANSSGGPDSSFWFGLPGESRIVGDWNGDGKSTPGVYNPSTGVWKLRNSNTTGPADITVQYGGPSWTPVVGDWDGNGTTTIGVYDQVVGTWRLKNSNTPGGWDVEFGWGGSVWKPVVGDWDGNGTTTVGIYEPSVGTWRLKNSNTPGGWDVEFGWGGSVWKPVVGDWNGDGKTTVGGYEPNVGTWRLKNSNTAGGWDAEFQYGGYPWSSVTGDWNGDGVDTIGVAN